jgi:hypothetical protein
MIAELEYSGARFLASHGADHSITGQEERSIIDAVE